MIRLVWMLSVALLLWMPAMQVAAEAKPNLLIVTVDDMSCDSMGVYGCRVPETTPRMDAFASTALRFQNAHVLVGNCMPGRNLMWSGLYSHTNGVEGFQQNKSADYPVLCDLAKQAGYFTAIRGKVSHSTPYTPYAWDAVLDTDTDGKKHHIKDPSSYGDSTRQGIELASKAGKPFCLMVNISDPHKPFYSQTNGKPDPHVPTRIYQADEMVVPGFLFENSAVRDELALYYSSVRRADDCFGSVLDVLAQTGHEEDTFVMFLSDHGMPLPFAKTQLYHHSTHTPLMVRWPNVTQAGSFDKDHFVSAIDFLPTLLDVMQTTHPSRDSLHGRSFAPVIRGQDQPDRLHVIKQYNENSGRWRHPMRAIQTAQWLYLYNPWSDGKRRFTTATTGTASYRQMRALSESDADIAARLDLFDHRVLEELYDVSSDPDCLHNRIDDPSVASELAALRKTLASELNRIQDPVAPLLANIEDAGIRQEFMAREDERSMKGRKKKKPQQAKKTTKKAKS